MPQITDFVNDNGIPINSRDDFMRGIVKKDFGLIVVCHFYKSSLNEMTYMQGSRVQGFKGSSETK